MTVGSYTRCDNRATSWLLMTMSHQLDEKVKTKNVKFQANLKCLKIMKGKKDALNNALYEFQMTFSN